MYFPRDGFDFILSDHRVEHIALFLLIAADSLEEGCVVVGLLADFLIDFLRFGGDNQQCLFLIALVQKMQNLRGGELEDDGVQRLIPVEQIPRDGENDAVAEKDIIPCVDTELFGEKDRDKISAAAGGVGVKTQIDGAGVQNAAEDGH